MGTSENLQVWSVTAADNDDADSSIAWSDSLAADAVDNSARSMMAAIRKYVKDTDGAITAGGSANLLTATTGQSISSGHLADGFRIGVWAANDNTSGTVTIQVDGLAAKAIKDSQGNALSIGAIQSGAFLDLVYEGGTGVFHAANINPGVASSPSYTDLTVTNDILLSSGSIINWNSGGITITESSDALAFAGASAGYSFDTAVTIEDSVYTKWTSADTDIDGLISGSTFGTLIKAQANGHMTFALRENGSDDGFQWISGGGDWNSDETYDTLAMSLTATGILTVANPGSTIDGLLDALPSKGSRQLPAADGWQSGDLVIGAVSGDWGYFTIAAV